MSIEDDIAFFERVPTLRLLGRTALRILAIGADATNHGGEVNHDLWLSLLKQSDNLFFFGQVIVRATRNGDVPAVLCL